MKKVITSFTFWLALIAFVEIYMHQIGQDSKSIVLISLNPILSTISRNDNLLIFMNSGMKIPCGTIVGFISVYWYVASVLSFFVYGVCLDFVKFLIVKQRPQLK